MFKSIKEFFFGKTPEEKAPEAPYKLETPVALGEPPATVVVVDGAGTVEVTQQAPAKKKPASKKPAGEKKPVAKKAGRKPKAKKQES
jgi:hypothetical protein